MKMKKLMKNKKGFTLMEMLIVVAIIVILVAISIPVFTSQLNNAKQATDDANERAAKGIAATEFLSKTKVAGTYYYDAANGKLETADTDIEAYGQYGENAGDILKVVIDEDGNITLTWE